MNTFPSLLISSLRKEYLSGTLTPLELVNAILERTATDPHHVWIHRLPESYLKNYAKALNEKDPETLPLYGIPFAIKDNIDLEGVPTTAACPDFSYTPAIHAKAVQFLIDAGAIPIGKTNMDQFATGLNGARSPYGACKNSFDSEYIAGGSSSGSAVSVALGYVSFALGTDTAGSGRVPAAFNNIIGFKPTCGWISTSGIVPACRSLDTISIFSLTAEDSETVVSVLANFDDQDPYSRPVCGHGFDFGRSKHFKLGVPRKENLQFFGNSDAERLFEEAVEHARRMGAETIEVDLMPFIDAAKLLYEGPWVAERYAAIKDFFDTHENSVLPVIREILNQGRDWSAVDAYTHEYKRRMLKRACDEVWDQVDVMITPVTGTIYKISEMEADPLALNTNLGYYTNFMNLLKYAAVSVPSGFQRDGLPFGITFFSTANQDGPLLHLADRWQRQLNLRLGATDTFLSEEPKIEAKLLNGQMRVAVCGAHMSGLPLNHELLSRKGRIVCATTSSPDYKLFALPGGPPYRPGMVRVAQDGAAIDVEVWELPIDTFGSFVAGIPAPLGIGTITLSNGETVKGFICETFAADGALDITHLGSWRRYLETLSGNGN